MNGRDILAARGRECCGRIMPPEELERLDEIIDRYSGRARYLIPALKDAQTMFGYLPREIQRRMAKGFGITPSQVYSVVTFYSYFTTVPRGRHTVRLCLGTACYVKGSKQVLDTVVNRVGAGLGETSQDGCFTVEAVRCLGVCGLAPVMLVDDDVQGNVGVTDAIRKLACYH